MYQTFKRLNQSLKFRSLTHFSNVRPVHVFVSSRLRLQINNAHMNTCPVVFVNVYEVLICVLSNINVSIKLQVLNNIRMSKSILPSSAVAIDPKI